MEIMKDKYKIITFVLIVLFILSYILLSENKILYNKESETIKDVQTKLLFVSSPAFVSNVYLSDDEIKDLTNANIKITDNEFVLPNMTCKITTKDRSLKKSFDYFLTHYRVLENPSDPDSTATRSLSPVEVGINSQDIMISYADCEKTRMSIFNDPVDKKIIIEYKNSFFKLGN